MATQKRGEAKVGDVPGPLEVSGPRARKNSSCRSTTDDDPGEVHTSGQDSDGHELIGGTRDLQGMSQSSQEGGKGCQGQEQAGVNINGISRGHGRVPEVPSVAPGARELSAEDLKP